MAYNRYCNQVGPAGVGPNQAGPNQLGPVVTAPTQVYNQVYHPQMLPVIHPIEVINQHHIVPVPKHYFPVTVKNECCGPIGRISRSSSRGMRKSR
ncbi:hypothetical protein [Paenibacillus sp. SYP-B4298]|uniref:hypothetical protein n=1 Tax=Paenibacillus sp. SYP-B4298 TaxID=2996034 RepID=UPI0022DD8D5E|nr:hypothetical protein [Paenibacillus sp. SYP-B4298]